MSKKLPYFPFFPGDWLRDPISGCSLPAQGLWLRMMIVMHDSERYGYLSLGGRAASDEWVASRVGCPVATYRELLSELDRAQVPSRTPESVIFSRRMVRDASKRAKAAKRQQKHRGRSDDPVTDLSRSRHSDMSDVRGQSSFSESFSSSNSLSASTSVSTSSAKQKTSTRDVDADAQIKISEEEIPELLKECRRVQAIVPVALNDHEQNKKDKSLIFKAVVLSRTQLSEDWLEDSLEAVRRKPKVPNKAKYFHGVLRSKCKGMGKDFNQLLRQVFVPDQILNGAK